jgi:excisionase family DNA binding protein
MDMIRTTKLEPFKTICATDEAAKAIGVTRGRIRQMVRAGELQCRRIGLRKQVVLLDAEEVKRLAEERPKTGRPRGGLVQD